MLILSGGAVDNTRSTDERLRTQHETVIYDQIAHVTQVNIQINHVMENSCYTKNVRTWLYPTQMGTSHDISCEKI